VVHAGTFDQTRKLLEGPLAGLGVATTFLDARDPADVARALRRETRLLYVDSPSNPLLDVIDLRAMAELARPRGIELFVDSTFASPFLQQPLALGATLVVHSATKFLAGHSDVMCGAVAGRADLLDRIRVSQVLLGTILDPQGASLLLRGIKTLGVRIERQSASALQIARYLAGHLGVAEVRYPWLEGTPDEALGRRQMRGGGGVVTFRLAGGRDLAARFLDRLQLVAIATSLGGVESVAELPYDLDFDSDAPEAEADLRRGFVRLSVGLEDLDDLLGDIDRALA
jgi:cystathionine beta-lyase/cystathionine gamma-synthase